MAMLRTGAVLKLPLSQPGIEGKTKRPTRRPVGRRLHTPPSSRP